MEIIQLKGKGCLLYPIGTLIHTNIPIINDLVDKLINELLKKKIPGKNVVLCCRGSSGAIMAAIAATKIKGSRIFHIKKPGECSHCTNTFPFTEGEYTIAIDDFMCSGETMKHIHTVLKDNDKSIDCVVLGRMYSSEIDMLIHLANPKLLICKLV